MRALITGAGGQVGRALIASAPPGIEIIAVSRLELDIGDADAVAALVRKTAPTLMVNAAAYTAVDDAEREPECAHRVNAAGALHLAAAAADAGAGLVQLSTDFVFDGERNRPYPPEAVPAPLGVYGESKLEGERAVLERLPDRTIVLRTSWVYSAIGRNFLLTMLRLMREQGRVEVVADQIGAPTAAHSVAEAVWALARLRNAVGIWHWSDAGVASWYDFAVAISEEAEAKGLLPNKVKVAPIMSEDYATAARRPAYSVLDARATQSATGLAPPHWRTNLRRVLGELQGG